MRNIFLASCLLVAGCSTAPEPTDQQAAVSAFIRANLPDSTSYEPVRWGKMAAFRARDAAALDLPDASRRYVAATAKLNHDSAGYVLVSTTAQQFHTSDQDVANVQQMYQQALANRDSARAALRRVVASQNDTTRLGYRLAHVFRANTSEGKLTLDSAGFLVNLHGVVIANVPAHSFLFVSGPSNRARFLGIAPPPPSEESIPLDAHTIEELNKGLQQPTQR